MTTTLTANVLISEPELEPEYASIALFFYNAGTALQPLFMLTDVR